ncbi:MAG: DUF86 domain-containing protein [Nanoarchaeota archaeon]
MSASRILKKIKEIEESLELIEENLPDSEKDFRELGLVKDGIYKRLEFCIQNIIDILSMIYSEENLGVPSTIDDILLGLGRKKIFSKEIVLLVSQMKGMRNILTHRYGEINDSLVYEQLTENLSDFHKLISAVEKHLSKCSRLHKS